MRKNHPTKIQAMLNESMNHISRGVSLRVHQVTKPSVSIQKFRALSARWSQHWKGRQHRRRSPCSISSGIPSLEHRPEGLRVAATPEPLETGVFLTGFFEMSWWLNLQIHQNIDLYMMYIKAIWSETIWKIMPMLSYAINYALIKSNNGNLMDHIRKAPSHSLTLSAILRRAVRNLRRRRFPVGFFGTSVEMETGSSDVCILESCVESSQGHLYVHVYIYIYIIHIYLCVCFTLESNLRNGCGFMHIDHRFSKALVKPS